MPELIASLKDLSKIILVWKLVSKTFYKKTEKHGTYSLLVGTKAK